MIGIGVDITEVDRIRRKANKADWLKVVFTEKEIALAEEKGPKETFFAGRFCVKEAFMKAVGIGWSSKAEFLEIEVLSDPNGKPFVNLYGKTKSYFEEIGGSKIMASISHTKTTAVGMVVIL